MSSNVPTACPDAVIEEAGPELGEGFQPTEAGLDIRNLTVTYDTDRGPLRTVRNVSLHIGPGEVYGLVGESGSGKTTLARAAVRYLPANGRATSGSVALDGIDLLALSSAEIRRIWGAKISMVHQDPSSAVNPSIVIGEQIAEVARLHLGMDKSHARAKAIEMLTKVRMPDPEVCARRYAHQLSGGQLQRVLIAIALTTNPRLLIMDEPTTALDVTTEAVILDLVRDLLPEYRTAVLYITHNLGVVAGLCHRVAVMYAGELVEEGTVRQVFRQMLHPYTLGLLGCVPRVDVRSGERDIILNTIPGFVPRPDQLPAGCVFGPRCAMVEEACREAPPPLQLATGNGSPVQEDYAGHLTACRRWRELRAPSNVPTFQQPAPTSLSKKPALSSAKEPALSSAKGSNVSPAESRDLGGEPSPVVLEARNVRKYFKVSGLGLSALWRRPRPMVRAVDDMSVRVRGGFTMGIVGESGCGKTTFARCIAGLEEASAGEIELDGVRLPYAVSKRPRALLKKIQMVFQNPDGSLNPQHTVGQSVGRPLELLGNVPRAEIDSRVRELFQAVNLPEDYIRRLPHELSGGEKQRVAIARAIAADPALVICDEPISSLDVSVQAALMNLLMELQQAKGVSYLFISHDLAAVRHLSDWIAVVYLGRLWEVGSAHDVFSPPRHPYTEALLSALPIPDPDAERQQIRLHGNVPSAVNIPPGCRFHTRCPRKVGEICERVEPPWQEGANPEKHLFPRGRGDGVFDFHRICCHIPMAELRAMQSPAGLAGQSPLLEGKPA